MRLARIPHLDTVDFDRSAIGDEGVRALAVSKSIHSFFLDYTGVTDAGLAALADVPEIRRLSVKGQRGVTDAGVTQLPLNRVEYLNLSRTRCGDGSLDYMRGRWADVATLGGDRPTITADLYDLLFTDEGLAHLGSAPALDLLKIGAVPVTGAGFAAFARPGEPRPGGGGELEIDAKFCPLTPAGAAALGTVPRLTRLELAGPEATDAVLAGLAGAHRLQRLRLRDAPATGVGFAALSDCRGLTELTLDDLAVTDDGLRAIGTLPAIQTLRVSNGYASDQFWAGLAEARTLTSVSFTSTSVGGPGLAGFARHRGPRRAHRGPGRASSETTLAPLWHAALRAAPQRDWLTGWELPSTPQKPSLRAVCRLQGALARPLPALLWTAAEIRVRVPALGAPECRITRATPA